MPRGRPVRTRKTEYPGYFGPRVTRVTTYSSGDRVVTRTSSGTELAAQLVGGFAVAVLTLAVLAALIIVAIATLLTLPFGGKRWGSEKVLVGLLRFWRKALIGFLS